MTPKQIGLVRALLHKAGLTEQKEDLAFSFSDGRTEHLSDMDYTQTQAMVKYLNNYLGQDGNPADKMRRKILSIAHELNWELPGSHRIDIARVNNWCIAHTGAKKPLDGLSLSELNKAVTGITNYYMQYLKGI